MSCKLLVLLIILSGVMANKEREPRSITDSIGDVLGHIDRFMKWLSPYCGVLGSILCKLNIEKIGGCLLDIGCSRLEKIYKEEEKNKREGRAFRDDLVQPEAVVMREIKDMLAELEDGIQELGQEVNQAQIKELYGDDLDKYFSIRKLFNLVTITNEGIIVEDEYLKDFISAANDDEGGLAQISNRIYRMLVGTHSLSTKSLFKALPESCHYANFFVRVMADGSLLGNLALTMSGSEVDLRRLWNLKNEFVLINNQFVTHCGFPPEILIKVRSDLRSWISLPLKESKMLGEVEEL